MSVFLAKAAKYQLSLLTHLITLGIDKLDINLKGKKSALLKPNIVNVAKPDSAKITHPMFVEAVIDVLREIGIDDITVGDGPAVDADVGRVFDFSGYSQLARRKKVKLVNFDDTESITVNIIPKTNSQDGKRTDSTKNPPRDFLKSKHHEIKIPKLVNDVDLYINIPKLKTHVNAGVSISLKNQIGLLSREDKKRFHLMGLHEPITQLSRVVHPGMIIVDGITGSEGEAPIHGKRKDAGVLAMGTDMLEVDLVCSQIMGVEPSSVKHIHLLLSEDGRVPHIEILGERIEELRTMFLQPNHRYGKVLNIYSWRNPRSCPLCSNAFNQAIEVAKKTPACWLSFFPRFVYQAIFKRIDLIKGPSPEMPEDDSFVLCFGDCAQKTAEAIGRPFVPGCPPNPEGMLEGLKQLYKR